jgi:L,D-transpeptidase YcbB
VTIAWKTMSFVAASLLPLAAVPAQNAPAADPIAPLPEGQLATEPPSPVLPPPFWMPADAQALLAYINNVGAEGLDPRDYQPQALVAAMRSGDPVVMSRVATERYMALAKDLAMGHVRGKDRQDWHVTDDKFDEETQLAILRDSLQRRDIASGLDALLPTHPQYLSLRAALAKVDKTNVRKVNRVRLNMDRWRWLPRDLGSKYIIVNVPSFHATLVQDGVTRWKDRAIAGAIKTKTPQLSVMATGVNLNPWWEVPPSITGEVAGKPGYVAVKGKDGKVQRWRQPPGPGNALGKLKFVMINPQNIYLHDTNARSRFAGRMRALSHGCVRTQNVIGLAKLLLADDNGEWTPDKVDETLASGKTVTAKFVKPLPVYIVYFSSAALNDGTIVDYDDLYKRDDRVIAALLDNDKPKTPATPTRKTAAN